MGNGAEDVEVESQRVVEAYKGLESKNKDHELLRLGTLSSDGELKLTDEFWERYQNEGDPSFMFAWMRYRAALRAATQGIPYRLTDSRPPASLVFR